jgi:hypothetical protein
MGSRSIFKWHRAVVPALLVLSVLSVSVAIADDSDPPGRVARLSFTKGAVSLQPAGVQDWADATLNRPLTTGDKLWTDQDSRAELDLGSAAVRLGSTTGFSFLNLDDQTTQMSVTAGAAIVHVRDLGENQSFEIDTPNIALTVQSPGDYRIEVNDTGDTTVVKVSNGDAQVNATGQTVPMHTQQAYTFTGTDQVTVDAGSVGTPDVLDAWSLDRDHHAEQAESSQYVSADVAGSEDLDDYGTWQSTPDYGPVWTPTSVAAGWSPYHFGRWVWVAPWGWTWVDDAPWGFAPFHYGRWAYVGSRWAWVPGPRRIRPVYAPALVAWVGSPVAGVSIGIGGAGVGWFPLGPREVFVPGYHVSNNYVRNVNISNTTIVNNTYITNVYENRVSNITYANRNRPGGVTAVSQTVFTSAQPVSGHTMHIPEGELAHYGARGAAPAIAPVRESVLGRRPEINVRRPPAAFANRPVVARIAPPPPPVAFERQQQAIRTNGNRPLARSQIVEMQPRAPNPRVRVVAPGPVRPVQNGGARQFGTDRPVQQGGRPAEQAARPGGFGVQQQQQQQQQTLQERERALHATPIPPSQHAPTQQTAPPPVQRNLPPSQQNEPRNDRPPQGQMRQNDQFRPQNDEQRRQTQEVRPTPEAHPIQESRPIPQARPIEQPRPIPQARPIEQPRPLEQLRPIQQQHPVEQQRPIQQQHPVEQPRPIQQQHPVEQPRQIEQPQAHAIEPPPRAAPPPQQQQRQATPPAHVEERKTKPGERPN